MATQTLPQFVNGAKPSPKPVRLSGLGRGIGLAAFKPDGAGRLEGGSQGGEWADNGRAAAERQPPAGLSRRALSPTPTARNM